jgi:hypothetical protein
MAALSPALLGRGGSGPLGVGSGDGSSRFLTRGQRSAAAGLAVAVLGVLVTLLVARPMYLAGLPLHAAGQTWRPGQGFDLIAARQLVEGSEIIAASYGLASRFRAVTAVCGLAALVLFALR